MAKTEMNRTMRSAEATRLWKSKRGSRVLENAEKNREGEVEEDDALERRAESSLSLRIWMAFEARASSRILTIFSINCVSSSAIFAISLKKISALISILFVF